MAPLGQFVGEESEPRNFESGFFERAPLRSNYFIAGTALVVFNLAVVGFVLVRHWLQIPTFAMAQIGLAVAAMVALWGRAYTTWNRFHEVYSQAKSVPTFRRSSLDIALRNAAALMGATIYFPFFSAAWLLLALGTALRAR